MDKRNKIKRQKRGWDDLEEKVLKVCLKLIIPVAILWGITGCIVSVLNFMIYFMN